ncbi:MAG: OmpH family outer membrane protein [Acidobacteria bacterium]|nr:OmpH family outer membrane protein [Acidobacteriota bacterium]
MRIYRLIAVATFLVAITALPAFAQQRPAAAAATPAAASNAPIPDSKIALINTDFFADEKQGIGRLVNAVKKVDAEFTPRRNELQTLKANMDKLTTDIQATANVATPQTLQQKQEQLEGMKREYQRKGEDAQAAYNKRLQESVGPLYEDIGKNLDAFAKARGITLLLDAAKIGPAILAATDAMDVTRAFIAEYNSKNPATASAR